MIGFDQTMEKITKMAVWVRLLGLLVDYFKDDVFKLIIEKFCIPLKLDRTVAVVERGKFARGVVEINLANPLVSMVCVQNMIQRVEYEALHVVCFECGFVGHRVNSYPNKAKLKCSNDELMIIGGDSMLLAANNFMQ